MNNILSTVLTACLMAATCSSAANAVEPDRRPEIEIVFALDTTSSMGGLLEGAKQKIWAIANEVAKGRPAPRVKMGLVAFRDRGDAYVTQVFDLTSNLDKTYQDLLSLRAEGGGDGPEHVLKGLQDAVDKIGWSRDPKAFKVLYVVGDAPPHEDYDDTPALPKLLEAAVRKGIVVNAIGCGSDASMTEAWRRIARLGEGRFLQIAQNGGSVAAAATPFDARLGELSGKLESTTLGFGASAREVRANMRLSAAVGAAAPAAAAAERAVYKARAGFSAESDLAEAVASKRVALGDLKAEDLPEQLKALTPEQRRAKLEAVQAERKALREELGALSAKRSAYLAAREAAKPADSFDKALVDSLKDQAASKGIAY